MLWKIALWSGRRGNKGSILLLALLLFQVLLFGIFLFSRTFISLNQIVRLQDDDIRLELLGLSGAARARWLATCGRDRDHILAVNLPNPEEVRTKLSLSPVPFREVFENGVISIAFDQQRDHFYVLVHYNRHGNRKAERLLCGTLSHETSEITSLSTY